MKRFYWHVAVCFIFALSVPSQAFADCTNPAKPEGVIIYNVDHDTPQFCDGANWISMTGGLGTEADPQVGATTNNQWCRGDGSAVQCDQPAPLFTQSFESTEQSITFGSRIAVNHSLSGTPKLFQVIIRNKTAEHDFNPGDEVMCTMDREATNTGCMGFANATQVGVHIGDGGIEVLDDIGDDQGITTSRWRIVLRAWR